MVRTPAREWFRAWPAAVLAGLLLSCNDSHAGGSRLVKLGDGWVVDLRFEEPAVVLVEARENSGSWRAAAFATLQPTVREVMLAVPPDCGEVRVTIGVRGCLCDPQGKVVADSRESEHVAGTLPGALELRDAAASTQLQMPRDTRIEVRQAGGVLHSSPRAR